MENVWTILGVILVLFWGGFLLAFGMHAGNVAAGRLFGPITSRQFRYWRQDIRNPATPESEASQNP